MPYYLFLLFLTLSTGLHAQIKLEQPDKPPIDTSVIGNWPELGRATISPYGRYMTYEIKQGRYPNIKTDFVIQDTAGTWKREYKEVHNCFFSDDEHQAVFQQGDSLHFLWLGSNDPERVIPVMRYGLQYSGNGNWRLYKEKNGSMVLLNLLTSEAKPLGMMSDCFFVKNEQSLVLAKKDSIESVLQYMELGSRKIQSIWAGDVAQEAGNFAFDVNGEQMLFTVTGKAAGQDIHSIWCYRFGSEKAKLLLKDGDARIAAGLSLSGRPEFSGNGRWVFFSLFQRPRPALAKPSPDAVKVDVWSYKDRFLQPEQIAREGDGSRLYASAIATNGESFRQLDQGDRKKTRQLGQITGDEVVVSLPDSAAEPHLGPVERFAYPLNYYVLSLKDGARKLLKRHGDLTYFAFSPEGRWLVYYDNAEKNYYSYEFVSGSLRNLTGKLPAKFSEEDTRKIPPDPADIVAGWLAGDSAVLVYDNYDLWALDPSGRRPAINETAGYGAAHLVKLRVVENDGDPRNTFVWLPGDTLLLTGFNLVNKYNGFFRLVIGKTTGLRKLYMGPYTFYRTSSQRAFDYHFDDGMPPLKAARSDCWVVKRQSACQAPNYFITNDLTSFNQITHLAPQKDFNWLRTELITWRQWDGTTGQGVLYKPENFDPRKKYPVIFNYYALLTQRMYEFPLPDLASGDINIPWFVSRGYLVFTPDIHQKPGALSGKTYGEWAYNAVVPAAACLSKLPYVDAARMGINGHSFGGGETNYLVTHTHLFAAAAESAGPSDPVSWYLTLVLGSRDDQDFIESGQPRYGATPWQGPDLFQAESAVLNADKVTTPLLIMHNKEDGAVQWGQGVELYMALRRLNKCVWMLQYDGEGHGIGDKDAALDYTIRLTQFFDHYLKGSPPPKWMTEGVPTNRKGIETGYELDRSGKKP